MEKNNTDERTGLKYELVEKKVITEKLKTENQMLWVQRMNSVRQTATEIVNHELLYA